MEREKIKWFLIGVPVACILLLALHASLEFKEQHALVHGPRHGAIGTVMSVSLPTITLKNRAGETQTIHIGTSTLVLNGPQTLSTTSLLVGQNVVIIGEPNEARFIRILP